jgi:DNA-binding transcriptional MerR regulator
MEIAFRIGAVSRLTGLGIDTLRAWERRYQAVVPKRGGQRRGYDQQDIDRLILLRRAVEAGHSIGSVARLANEDLEKLLANGANGSNHAGELIQPLMAALENFDYASLNEQLGRYAALLPTSDLVHQVVLPLMREVGERWHAGSLTIAQEHMTTGLVLQILGTLMRQHRPAANAIKMVFTTPQGEQHEVGVLAAAILAAGIGFSPIYLGPNLPASEVALAMRKSGAKVVVLQVTDQSVAASEPVKSIQQALPAGAELWIGGDALAPQDGVVTLSNFDELEQQYRRLAAA